MNEQTDEQWRRHWSERQEDAQLLTQWIISRKAFARIPYGQERAYPKDLRNCHDCGISPGRYHVPGCDMEQCPNCKGQAISCYCDYADGQAISQERSMIDQYWQRLMETSQE